MGGQVVQDHIDPAAVRAPGADGLERCEGVGRGLAAPHDAPQLVVADAVAAVELAHAVELVVVRAQPLGTAARRPARPAGRANGQRPELVEREHPVWVLVRHMLDAVQLRVTIGVVGLLPGLGAPERDP